MLVKHVFAIGLYLPLTFRDTAAQGAQVRFLVKSIPIFSLHVGRGIEYLLPRPAMLEDMIGCFSNMYGGSRS